jgi:hypothetical protein
VSERDLILYGTEEEVPPLRIMGCGPLGFALRGGNVRYITWGGMEVLRAISFVVRDSRWGTYAPAISDLEISEAPDRLSVSYGAAVDGAEGDFAWRATISATADGSLSFEARGGSRRGFTTNRTGFVVLHPLAGVAGRPVEVLHTDGSRETASFPELVDPSQPIFDIRTLTHSPVLGLTVAVTMEGEAYEMEDQRNWTDASYKTYVRPLAKGYPYAIAAGEAVEQRITLKITGAVPAVRGTAARTGGLNFAPAGKMPEIGLALTSWSDAAPVVTSYLVGRIDLRAGPSDLPAGRETPVDLDVIIPGRDPDQELARLAHLASMPRRVLVVPARDMVSRPPGEVPAGEADGEAIVAAARRLFPRSMVGGGMLVGFPELNRNRPPAGVDFVAHSTSAIVHAADDRSVMETLEALPAVIASARAFAGDIPYRLGPATIGAPQAFYPAPSAPNPENARKPTADADPRQRGLFAAAFAIGYAAAVAGQVEALTLGATSGAAGIMGPGGPYPIATAVKWLAELAGCPFLRATAPAGLAVLAAEHLSGRVVLAANLSASPVALDLSGRHEVSVLDAEALARGRVARRSEVNGPVTLDAYAICRAVAA